MDTLKLFLNSHIPKDRWDDFTKDVNAMSEEFEVVNICEDYISVITESVILADGYVSLDLGKFEIKYYGDEIECVAITPNHPNNDERITHPCVMNNDVCFGEIGCTIRRAKEECRIFDIFLMINTLLNTYNKNGNYYLGAEDWYSHPCSECGDFTSEEIKCSCGNALCDCCGYTCERCGNVLCRDCVLTCSCCDYNFCEDCLQYCDCCNESFCEGCRILCSCGNCVCENCSIECDECGKKLCKNCTEENDGEVLCEDCKNSKKGRRKFKQIHRNKSRQSNCPLNVGNHL